MRTAGACLRTTPRRENGTKRVSPEAIQEMAAKAKTADPSIVDTVSNFYAQHTTLCKTLGGAALSICLAKVAQRTQA